MSQVNNRLPPPGQPVVRVSNLNHYFGQGENRTHTLKNINLEVMPGELVILSGPSGCGKTTLLTLLGGLRTLQEGNIEIWDADLGSYRSLLGLDEASLVHVRRSIGFIFQRHNLLESLTATQNVRMAQNLLPNTSNPDEESARILTYLGIGHRLHYKAQAISGGQRQRVAIARALINVPRLVLADEPTAALDEHSSTLVISLLKWLARTRPELPDSLKQQEREMLAQLTPQQGTTSLIVTHDSRIMNEADRIVEMYQGEIETNVVVSERKFLYEGLRRCPAFAALLPEQLYKLADEASIQLAPDVPVNDERIKSCNGKVEAFEHGRQIMRQGDEVGDDSKFYMIREGTVEVRQDRGQGEHWIIDLNPRDFFGDRGLVKNEPRNASIYAKGRVVAYAFPFGKLKKSIERNRLDVEQFIERFEAVYGRQSERTG